MGRDATWWAHRWQVIATLDATKRGILWAAAPYSIDETGWLPHWIPWLAKQSGVSKRSLERHLPPLEKLEYLVRGENGFRLAAYLRDRQNGGVRRQFAEKEKESTKEKEKAPEDRTDFPVLDKSSNWKNRGSQQPVTIHTQVLAVLALFEALPCTLPANADGNLAEAELWFSEGCSLASITGAMLIGISRRIASGPRDLEPEPVVSLRFFREIVREFREADPGLFRNLPAGKYAAIRLGQLPGLSRRKQEFYARLAREVAR